MWKGWDERGEREQAVFDFWDALERAAEREAATEYLWRRPGSPTMEERRD